MSNFLLFGEIRTGWGLFLSNYSLMRSKADPMFTSRSGSALKRIVFSLKSKTLDRGYRLPSYATKCEKTSEEEARSSNLCLCTTYYLKRFVAKIRQRRNLMGRGLECLASRDGSTGITGPLTYKQPTETVPYLD